jgi:biopolymer transport protein ExbD
MHGYASLSIAVALALSACSAGDTNAPPVVTQLAVTIDANNDCQLEAARVECAQVASVIKSRYPTSTPRVDVCLDKGTRYEAALEVMNSLSAAGLVLGKFGCEGAG